MENFLIKKSGFQVKDKILETKLLTVLILCSLQSTLGKSVVVSGERVMLQGVRVSPTAPKRKE